MKNTFKTVLSLMKMTLRCSVCVVCNIVHEIVEFFKRMVRKLKGMTNQLHKNLKQFATAATKFFGTATTNVKALFGKGVAKKGSEGSIKSGEKCGLDSDCETGFCAGGFTKVRLFVVAAPTEATLEGGRNPR